MGVRPFGRACSFRLRRKKTFPSVKWFCQYPDPRLLNSGFLLDFSPDGARRDSSGQKMFKNFKFCSRQGRLFFAKPRVALHKLTLTKKNTRDGFPGTNARNTWLENYVSSRIDATDH